MAFIDDIKRIPITDYAQSLGFTVTQKGRYFSLKEHDSVIIDPDKNCFWRNSTGDKGSVIDFAIAFGGTGNAKEAMGMLKGRYGIDNNISDKSQNSQKAKTEPKIPEISKELILPPKANENKAVYMYLVHKRGIDIEIFKHFEKRGNIYQDEKRNCVFVGYDWRDKNNTFANNLRVYLQSADPNKNRQTVFVGKTPNVLLAVGAKQLDMVMRSTDIEKCMATAVTPGIAHPHGFSFEEMAKMPELLSNPVMVFKGSHADSMVVVTDKFDKNNDPVIISVQLDSKQDEYTVNRVTSMYGRVKAFEPSKNIYGRPIDGYIKRNFDAGNLLAYNKEKAPAYLLQTGLSLPVGEDNIVSYDDSITASFASVKPIDGFNKNLINTVNTQNKPVFASLRGTGNTRFMQDLPGCDYGECLLFKGKDAKTLVVTESPIDALSYMTLNKMEGSDYKDFDALSLGGVTKTEALFNYVTDNPDTQGIVLAFDNDDAGRGAANKAKERLEQMGFGGTVTIDIPEQGKDWNDVLTAEKDVIKQNAENDAEFHKSIDDYLSGGTKPPFIDVLKTPNILKMLGVKADKIHLPPNVIDKCMATTKSDTIANPHMLDVDIMYKLPCELRNPALVMKSAKRSDSLVVVTGLTDKFNNPIIVSLANKLFGRLEVSMITSMYGKEKLNNYVNTNIDKVIAINEKKANAVFRQEHLLRPVNDNRRGGGRLGTTCCISFNHTIAYSTRSVKRDLESNRIERNDNNAVKQNAKGGEADFSNLSKEDFQETLEAKSGGPISSAERNSRIDALMAKAGVDPAKTAAERARDMTETSRATSTSPER